MLIIAAILLATCRGDPTGPRECPPDWLELNRLCWTHLGLENEWITAVAVTPWGLFAGTADRGIFRQEPDGSWTALGPQSWHHRLMPRALLYVPGSPPRLLAGMYFRHDSRDTTQAAVYASLDRGETWQPADGALADDAPDGWRHRIFVYDLAVDPGDPNRLFMGLMQGVLRSLDGGETWDFVYGEHGWLSNGHVHILIDPTRNGRVLVAGQGYVFAPFLLISEDWGESWKEVILACGNVVVETAPTRLALDPHVSNRLFAGAQGGLFQSDARGARGTWICPQQQAPVGTVAGFVELNRVLYAATVTVDFEFGGPAAIENSQLGLYRTRDGTARWEQLAVPQGAEGATTGFATDPGRNRILIGTRAGIWAVAP